MSHNPLGVRFLWTRVKEILVFDIGGVFVKLGGMQKFVNWTGQNPETIKSRWLSSCAVSEFESGRLSFQHFASAVISEFGLPIEPDELRQEMHLWAGELFDGAHELLAEVTARHPVACLCNSNDIQWPIIRDKLGLGEWFLRER